MSSNYFTKIKTEAGKSKDTDNGFDKHPSGIFFTTKSSSSNLFNFLQRIDSQPDKIIPREALPEDTQWIEALMGFLGVDAFAFTQDKEGDAGLCMANGRGVFYLRPEGCLAFNSFLEELTGYMEPIGESE